MLKIMQVKFKMYLFKSREAPADLALLISKLPCNTRVIAVVFSYPELPPSRGSPPRTGPSNFWIRASSTDTLSLLASQSRCAPNARDFLGGTAPRWIAKRASVHVASSKMHSLFIPLSLVSQLSAMTQYVVDAKI